MAYEKEYDSFKTQNGESIELYLAIDKDGNWNYKYDLHPIFCPECGVAQLKFTSASNNRGAFLSTLTGASYSGHSEDCSHRHRVIGKRYAKDFYNTCTPEQAMDKISACINLLKRRAFILAEGDGKEPPHRPRLTATYTLNGKSEVRRLRTRSFYSVYKLDNDDIDVPIVFYGRVRLSVEQKTSKTSDYKFNVLKVKSLRSDNRQLQSIYLGMHTIELVKDHEYLFSMVGIAKEKNGYINIQFYNNNYNLYRIEEPD